MNRKKKFALNAVSGLIKQMVTILCGFILTRAILLHYGSVTNGLVASITQFLGFITFLEMGIGPVIQTNLYKPLADKNCNDISAIVKASNSFFRRIGSIFIFYIILLCIIFPRITESGYSNLYTISLLVIISISTIAQYFLGMTYQLLLNADQKGYIQISMQWITTLFNTILCVVLMNVGASIHIVKLVTTVVFVFRPVFLLIYVKKHYPINSRIQYDKDPIKQKWNGFAQHFAAVVVENTDVAVLTILSSFQNVSVYTVYYSVIYGITQVIMTAVNGLEAMWGNMIAKEEWNDLRVSFEKIEWAMHCIVLCIFTTTAFLITPFISVYTQGISDANYYQPLFGVLLAIAYCMQCLRVPYFRLIKAVGHYKETQIGAFISMGLNVVVSIVFVFKFGLIGVAIGTIIALTYHTIYFVCYLSRNVMRRSIKYFFKYLLTDVFIAVVGFMINYLLLTSSVENYFDWIVLAFKAFGITLMSTIIVNLIFYRDRLFTFLRHK